MPEGSGDVHVRDGKVVMIVRGFHAHDIAVDCARKVLSSFRKLGRAELVIDLTELESFDREGRIHWQEQLRNLRTSVHTLTMIGGSPLVRMAGAAVCLYAGIKMRVVGSLDEAFTASPSSPP